MADPIAAMMATNMIESMINRLDISWNYTVEIDDILYRSERLELKY